MLAAAIAVGGTERTAVAADAFAAPSGQIVFVRGAERVVNHLVVARSDGTLMRQLADGPGCKQDPQFSPDGKWIAYRYLPKCDYKGDRIRLMRVDGKGSVDLTTKTGVHGHSPSWSRDGKRIAFAGGRAAGEAAIWVVGVDGSGLRQLTSFSREAQYPAWSPDGRKIAFTYLLRGNFDIYAMSADGSRVRQLGYGR